jgi:hypothetical protein
MCRGGVQRRSKRRDTFESRNGARPSPLEPLDICFFGQNLSSVMSLG